MDRDQFLTVSNVSAKSVNRPILRWAGSKRSAAQKIAAFWNGSGRYLEPFCGSAAVFFSINPSQAILSDINRDLISFYTIATAFSEKVYSIFSEIPRTRETYNHLRAEYSRIDEQIEKAAVFYYLNRNCFNGLFRTNKNGVFNVPFTSNRVARYLSMEEFSHSCKILSEANLECGDFFDVIYRNASLGDFVYLDPPYASSKRLPFREYHQDSFGIKDLDRLYYLLEEIDDRGGIFVLSYDDGEGIKHIKSRWSSTSYSIRRNISGFSAARRMSTEQIITNAQINP